MIYNTKLKKTSCIHKLKNTETLYFLVLATLQRGQLRGSNIQLLGGGGQCLPDLRETEIR